MHALPHSHFNNVCKLPHISVLEKKRRLTYLLTVWGQWRKSIKLAAGIGVLIIPILQHDSFVCRCDRVLWYGDRMRQVAYRHGDSRLSDHRSVSAIFLAEVDVVNSNKLRKACVLPKDVEIELVAKAVVPRVAPIIDVEKLQNNEVWSTILWVNQTW